MEEENSFLGIPDDTYLPPKDANVRHYSTPKWLWGIAGIATVFFIIFFYEFFVPVSSATDEISFEIKKGESLQSVVGHLKNANLIHSLFLFEWYARLRNISTHIQAGTYTFFRNQSPNAILSVLSSVSPSSNEITVTIPEGWTVQDIAAYLENQKLFSAKDFLDATKLDFSIEFPFLQTVPPKGKTILSNPLRNPLQGYLFPDTYRFFKDATPKDVIQKMLTNFDAKLTPELRNEVILQRKNISGIILIASLLEEEVRSSEDKAIVSGILWKRLQLGIPLQVDATIVFITSGGGSQRSKYGISLDDLKIDSPYNTYKYRGLPLGPISNPGLQSIEAAIYPQASPYLYYLSAPDGHTVFSKTLEEHNAAKAKYLK